LIAEGLKVPACGSVAEKADRTHCDDCKRDFGWMRLPAVNVSRELPKILEKHRRLFKEIMKEWFL
jgi:hypothetical protein